MNRFGMLLNSLLASLLLALSPACGSNMDMPPAPKGPANVDQFDLTDANYYPESLTVSADGTIYVGSLGTGRIMKFNPQTTAAVDFVPSGVLKAVAGVLADDAKGLVWVCAVDLTPTNPMPPTIKSFSMADGSQKGSYSFSGAAFPNDMVFDGKHNLYVADSLGKIWKLPDGGNALISWSTDAKLASVSPTGYGADGIAWDGAQALYVNVFTDGRLLKLPISSDGTAAPAENLTVTPALSFPDGMRMLDANTLILVEGAGKLTKLTLSGNSAAATSLQSGLAGPTSVVKYENYFYVSEGQLGYLFKQISGSPSLPFKVRRFPAQ